jgi:ribosomal-protein-serine acetyltransferase
VGLKPRPTVPSLSIGHPGAVLRPVRRSDRDELFALVDRERDRLRAWMPWTDFVRTPPDQAPFLDESHRLHQAGRAARMALMVMGRMAGVVSLESIDRFHRHAMIGYWIDAAHEGRGLVTGAVRALCDYGFTERTLHRIEIHVAPGNLRSRAIPERLGFVREGLLRQVEWVNDRFVDHVVYAMLAPDWPQ